MERKEYQDKIRELLQTVTTLLDQNKAMGERLEKADATISKANDEIEYLKSELARLKGETAMHHRKTYGKNGEKRSSGSVDKGTTKDERESEYIRNGSKPSTTVHEFLINTFGME